MKLKIHIIMFDIGVNNQTFEIPLYSSMLYIYVSFLQIHDINNYSTVIIHVVI